MPKIAKLSPKAMTDGRISVLPVRARQKIIAYGMPVIISRMNEYSKTPSIFILFDWLTIAIKYAKAGSTKHCAAQK